MSGRRRVSDLGERHLQWRQQRGSSSRLVRRPAQSLSLPSQRASALTSPGCQHAPAPLCEASSAN